MKNRKAINLVIIFGIGILSLLIGIFGHQDFLFGIFGGTIGLGASYAVLPKDWTFKQAISIEDGKYDERQLRIQGKIYRQSFTILSIGLILLGGSLDEGMLNWIKPGQLLMILGVLALIICSLVLIINGVYQDVVGGWKRILILSVVFVFPLWSLLFFIQGAFVKNGVLTDRAMFLILAILFSILPLSGIWAIWQESKKSQAENDEMIIEKEEE